METIEVKMVLDPEDQQVWADIIEKSVLSIAGVSREFNVNENQLRRYLKNKQRPQKLNMERMVTIMKKLNEQLRPPKHPSFGFATPDEIKRLNEIGIGAERDHIMEAIAKRTKLKGKRR